MDRPRLEDALSEYLDPPNQPDAPTPPNGGIPRPRPPGVGPDPGRPAGTGWPAGRDRPARAGPAGGDRDGRNHDLRSRPTPVRRPRHPGGWTVLAGDR